MWSYTTLPQPLNIEWRVAPDSFGVISSPQPPLLKRKGGGAGLLRGVTLPTGNNLLRENAVYHPAESSAGPHASAAGREVAPTP